MKEINAEYVWSKLLPRTQETNKGTYGKLLAVAGSTGFRGAAMLAAEAAARCGAGIVTLASVEPVLNAAVIRTPELCLMPCAAAEDGTISTGETFSLKEKASKCSAVLLGPGLGCTDNTKALVNALLPAFTAPVLLDADGLNCAATCPAFPHSQGPMVLTPHPGEMARLTGKVIKELETDRPGTALRYASEWNCILVLKGHRTLVAAPDGRLMINSTGNAGLARGGSGDVLSGIIAALLAQKLDAFDAAACGVWLHGAAADLAAAQRGQMGMLPHELMDALGTLFAQNGR